MPVERIFEINGMRLAAKEWGQAGGIPVIALHGWLDNAASFDRLASELPHCHLLALDMAGHGLSDHRPAQANYHIWGDLLDVLAVADAMGWQTFSLLGHSRGAMVATLLAAANPERILKLILLDGLLPIPLSAEDSPQQLALFLSSHRRLKRIKMPCYKSVEAAQQALCKSTKISEASAQLMVARGLQSEGDRYRWRSDPKLTRASAFKMTMAHNEAMIKALTMDCLLFTAKDGYEEHQRLFSELVPLNSRIEHIPLQGHHHMHMENQVATIANKINEFLGQLNNV